MSLESGLNTLSQARASKEQTPARKLTEKLFDAGSFTELGCMAAPEVITGCGAMDGAPVYVFVQDRDVNGGAVGKEQAAKIRKVYDLAAKTGCPIVGVFNSNGAYLKEGVEALAAIGELLMWSNNLSGVVPQISLIAGPCGGAFSLIAADADVVVKAAEGDLFLVANEEDKAKSVISVETETLDEAVAKVKEIVSLLPLNNISATPVADSAEPNSDACPICQTVDGGSFVEFQAKVGEKAVTGIARIAGQTVAVAMTKGGALDAASSAKVARMVRFADAFAIPVVSFVDCEGFASIKEASMVAHAYAEATTAKVSVITGSAIGSAYVAMAGTASGADAVYAWPQAVLSGLAPETAVAILWNEKLSAMKDPLTERSALVQEYADTNAAPFDAAKAGLLEEVIEPGETRARLIAALDLLAGKRISRLPKKHSNIQL